MGTYPVSHPSNKMKNYKEVKIHEKSYYRNTCHFTRAQS